MIERLIKKIASAQIFAPEDKLNDMIKQYSRDELTEESLDLVFAAHKDSGLYSDFLRSLQERDCKYE